MRQGRWVLNVERQAQVCTSGALKKSTLFMMEWFTSLRFICKAVSEVELLEIR